MMYYNLGRIHKTPRVTPAMEAGIADIFLDITDIAVLVEQAETKRTKRASYRERS